MRDPLPHRSVFLPMALKDISKSANLEFPLDLPVLPLRDVVVYPHMVIPLFVGRDKSIKALDSAMGTNKQILLIAQKSADMDDPEVGDLHHIGTLANILQLLKLPDGTVKVLVEGIRRARIDAYVDMDALFVATVTPLTETFAADEREQEVPWRPTCPSSWTRSSMSWRSSTSRRASST